MSESVSSYEAKTKLAELLRRAEKGETIAITRRGVEVAQLRPSPMIEQKQRDKAFAKVLELRKKCKPLMTPKEIKALIHEGHKR